MGAPQLHEALGCIQSFEYVDSKLTNATWSTLRLVHALHKFTLASVGWQAQPGLSNGMDNPFHLPCSLVMPRSVLGRCTVAS